MTMFVLRRNVLTFVVVLIAAGFVWKMEGIANREISHDSASVTIILQDRWPATVDIISPAQLVSNTSNLARAQVKLVNLTGVNVDVSILGKSCSCITSSDLNSVPGKGTEVLLLETHLPFNEMTKRVSLEIGVPGNKRCVTSINWTIPIIPRFAVVPERALEMSLDGIARGVCDFECVHSTLIGSRGPLSVSSSCPAVSISLEERQTLIEGLISRTWYRCRVTLQEEYFKSNTLTEDSIIPLTLSDSYDEMRSQVIVHGGLFRTAPQLMLLRCSDVAFRRTARLNFAGSVKNVIAAVDSSNITIISQAYDARKLQLSITIAPKNITHPRGVSVGWVRLIPDKELSKAFRWKILIWNGGSENDSGLPLVEGQLK